jgi:hypothetical protein
MKIVDDNPKEKTNNLWNHIYNIINASDNKYDISNLVYNYMKFFSLSLLQKMKKHSVAFKLDMKEIVSCVIKITY